MDLASILKRISAMEEDIVSLHETTGCLLQAVELLRQQTTSLRTNTTESDFEVSLSSEEDTSNSMCNCDKHAWSLPRELVKVSHAKKLKMQRVCEAFT